MDLAGTFILPGLQWDVQVVCLVVLEAERSIGRSDALTAVPLHLRAVHGQTMM